MQQRSTCGAEGFVGSRRRSVGAQSQSRQDRGQKNSNSHPDRVRSRHSEFGHSVEDVAGDPSLSDLRIPITRMQAIAKDPLVAHERVLSAGLLVIARFLLPLPTTNSTNTSNSAISRATSSTARLRGFDRRHNDLRASTDCSVIQRAAVVGTVADDSTDLAWHAIDEVHADVAVINTRISQSLADDHAIAVDTEVQLLPITNALAAVFSRSPLANALKWQARCYR
ncbi:MAG: hypothetical protein ACJAYX_002001 [Planctomycetota bacterium]|jgi:hypothetical protein